MKPIKTYIKPIQILEKHVLCTQTPTQVLVKQKIASKDCNLLLAIYAWEACSMHTKGLSSRRLQANNNKQTQLNKTDIRPPPPEHTHTTLPKVTVAGGGRPPTATDKHQPRRAELGDIVTQLRNYRKPVTTYRTPLNSYRKHIKS